MSITFQTGILFSLAFILSFRFNRRRTEDSTHPLWSLILYKLCGANLGRLLPTPQFRLYISPESSNPNETLSGAVLEVIPDFCILLYRAHPVKPKTLAQILQQITSSFLPSPHTVQISSLSIPLLVELKRPISRNCVDLKEFMSEVTSSMLKARKQVTAQALCLFSIPKHHDQDEVYLIAAVGEWWSFRLVSRSDFKGKIFQNRLYGKLLLQVKENENEDNEDMTHLMGSSQTGDMEKYQAQMKEEETLEEIRLRHDRERAKRLSKRERRRIDWSQNQSDLQKLIDGAKMGEPGVYAEKAMNEFIRLQSKLDQSWQRNWGTVFLEPNPASGLVDIEQQTEWSKVFRIGTQTSASYLDQISNKLARLVKQTSLEDLPVADPIVESNQTEPSHIQPDRVRTQSRDRNSSRHDSSHPGSRNPSYGPGSHIPDRPPSTTVRARPGGSDTQALTRNSQTDRRAPSRPVSRAPSRAGSGAPSPAGSGAPSPAGSGVPSPAGSRDPSIDPGSRARNPLRSSRIQPGSSNIQRSNQDERTKPSR
ncbi:hypothetical protein F5890DRAFT_1633061 [Lentinula detonsa]|uniref:Uncharacterized protein n=1 Tax=Lentinula detonsa TaxID=2804962 RepID=A0AA38UN28_9AGAR|nr:hypothetical protein F5890DRAFT_1633061 [Lentinula detonsa]